MRPSAVVLLAAASAAFHVAQSAPSISSGTLQSRAAAITYKDVAEQYCSTAMDWRSCDVSRTFGEVPTSEPYAVKKFPNATELLVLKPSVLIPQDPPYNVVSECMRKGRPSCCHMAKSVKGCQAWYDFIKFCNDACAEHEKCTGVDVRMATGECALYDSRLSGCWAERDDSESPEVSSFFIESAYHIRKPYPATPGYIAVRFMLVSDEVEPLEEYWEMEPEPCGSAFREVRQQNVDRCATRCDKNPNCTAFMATLEDFHEDHTACYLFGPLKWEASAEGRWSRWFLDSLFYVKNQTAQCDGKKQYYGFVLHGAELGYTAQGCVPMLKEGEACDRKDCGTDVQDLTNFNSGCAPGLKCLHINGSEWAHCTKPRSFLEETERQLVPNYQAYASPGKAIPRGKENSNSTNFLFFDFSHLDWDDLLKVAELCEKFCPSPDCTAFELNRKTKQCMVTFTDVCGGSPLENDADSVVITNIKIFKVSEIPATVEGFDRVVNHMYPVLPTDAETNENVRFHVFPCPATRSDERMAAMETECVERCRDWKDCHTVHFQPWVPQCVMFAGEEGKRLTKWIAHKVYGRAYVQKTRVGCNEKEFYGVLRDYYFEANASVTVEIDDEEWIAAQAQRGFGPNSDLKPFVVKGDAFSCAWAMYTPGSATCVPYFKGQEICKAEGAPGPFFRTGFINVLEMFLINLGSPICERGYYCHEEVCTAADQIYYLNPDSTFEAESYHD